MIQHGMKSIKGPKQLPRPNRALYLTFILAAVCILLITITSELAKLPGFSFIGSHRDTIISAELAVFGIVLVEIIGRVLITRFTERGTPQVGFSLRAIMRGAAYIALAIGIVSVLSASPALAIGIGTVSGVILGFAAQNLIGNVVAGMMLAIWRPVKIGDHVTVGPASGKVKEIDLIYTILDTDEHWSYVPSMLMFTSIVTKKKRPGEKLPE